MLDLKEGSTRTLFDFLIETELFFKINSQSYRQDKQTTEVNFEVYTF